MLQRTFVYLLALTLSATILAACGGQSDPTSSTAASSTTAIAPQTGSPVPAGSGQTPSSVADAATTVAAFSATASALPSDGATVSGVVPLEVHGSEMVNVELLPANSYTPKLGVFTISGAGTVALFYFDTTKLPNGPIQVRISAFDKPAGTPGAHEIVAMSPRTWNINN